MSFKYILRCAIQPGFYEEEKFKNLIKFCKSAKIDDVMFFINCEELNQGHLTIKETKPWIEIIKKVKKELEKINVTTSINPWITLLHCDRGRKLKEEQNFNLMVDPFGNKASAVVCPLCPEWRKYIKEIYSYYATVKPLMIWVEDDFRLHNHAPLIWGGCFCDLHMREFSRCTGEKVSRKDFFKTMLKPGRPDFYRKVWLDINRNSMVELAKIIGDAVNEVSPETLVGLMSSNPAVHCAEGRDWEGILSGLAGKNEKVNRPHLPAYSEDTPSSYLWNFSGISQYTQASVPADTHLYPELENGPWTRFSKSCKFTNFQITLALTMGIKGITLNIFDMMGNGPNLNERYQDILAERKRFFEEVSLLNLNLKNQEGVKVLFNSRSSYFIHTEEGKFIEEIYPEEVFWSQIFSCFGIANKLTENYLLKNEIIAISGQYFRSIGKKDTEALFKNNIMVLDGEAAETLYKIGLGKLAGIKNIKLLKQNTGIHSYEEIEGEYFGLSRPRLSCQMGAGDAFKIEYDKNVKIKSFLKSAEGKTVANGVAIYKKVIIFPYGHFKDKPICHLNPVRQKMFQEMLEEVSRNGFEDKLTFTIDYPYLQIYRYDFPDKVILMIVNCSSDDIKNFRFYAKNLKIDKDKSFILDSRTGEKEKANFAFKNNVYNFNLPIESMEGKLITGR